jgi:hypothetical protein
MKRTVLVIAALIACASSACLQKDVTSTIYLDPDAGVEWVVIEQQVRSDDGDSRTRSREEAGYVEALARDQHPVAEVFRRLGAIDTRTTRLRESRPWATRIEARFVDLTSVWEPTLTACGVPHGFELTTQDGIRTWQAWMDTTAPGAADGTCLSGADGLLDLAESKIVLTSGRFVSSSGFQIHHGDTATLDDHVVDEKVLAQQGGMLRLSLSWSVRQ